MSTLPSGTVTFCFTDIEGSTKLFAKLGPRFLDVLEEHRRIVRAAVAKHGGQEVKTEGDGFFIAFGDPHAGVRAAIDCQLGLAGHPWPEGGAVRVRIGLHVGEAEPLDDDYVAYAVHEAARLSAAAHGGQTVISDALASLVDGRLGELTLRDLGTHELKDIAALHLHQVCHPDLPDDFPVLRTASATRGYVPTPASTLVGRVEEIDDLVAQVRASRLVTVTGAGGVGKTRIAVEAAHAMLGSRADGVWFVDLAPLTDAAWIADTVLGALGIIRDPDVDARDHLRSFLTARDVLLVIDNCEHVVDEASSLVDELLRTCAGVGVLATSREPLGIAGEVAWRLRSLESSTGAELFVERAKHVAPDLVVDGNVLATIEQIVERLDGIPLAIELAAARTRVLTPAQIAERLDDRFKLLTGGSRTALARQRTLEAAVDWSYALLEEDERALLRRLSVFVGGFGLEAAEAVGGADALDLLERLVDKSLVGARLHGDTIRYRLLETIRHYAWLKLIDAGDTRDARGRHLAYVADLVDEVVDGLRDEHEQHVADTLALEHDNIRAALDWASASDDRASALRIASQMWVYWESAGRAREALGWLEQVLADTEGLDPDRVALARTGASHMAILTQRPLEEVAALVGPAVDRLRERGPGDRRWWDAFALLRWLDAAITDWRDRAPLIEEAMQMARDAGELYDLVDIMLWQADQAAGREGGAAWLASLEEIVDVARSSGSASQLSNISRAISGALVDLGHLDRALETAQEALAASRRGPHIMLTCDALVRLANAKARLGHDDALAHFAEAAAIAGNAGIEPLIAEIELDIGWTHLGAERPEVARESFERASALFGTFAASRAQLLLLWGMSQMGIAECAQATGDLDQARTIAAEMVALADASTENVWVRGVTRCALAAVDLDAGRADDAEAMYREAIAVLRTGVPYALRDDQSRATSLRGLAAVAHTRGDDAHAATLSGAASAVFEPNWVTGRVAVARNRRVVEAVAARLGAEAFERQWTRGADLGGKAVAEAELSAAGRA